MAEPIVEWGIEIFLSSGRVFKEAFATEQEADTRINQLKGANWLEIRGFHINPGQIAMIHKIDLRETPA